MQYSYSRLSTFKQCPFKYKLKYIDKIDPIIKDTIETFLGTIVHQTLEQLYQNLLTGCITSLDDLLIFFYHKWYENWNDEILIVKKKYSMECYQSRGKQFITDYYHQYMPFNKTKTISVEDRIIFYLDAEKNYQMQGYIDRLDESKSGNYEIHDYKTGSRLPSQNQLDTDRQLAIYALGVKHKYSDAKDIELVWHFLKFNKELRSKRSDQQLSTLSSQLISSIDTIENTKEYPRNPSILCHWCGYKPICPQYSHLYQIREHRENRYHKRTGKQLVDRYVMIKKQTNQQNLDSYLELEQLKKDIFDYAKREQLDVIYGTHSKIRIVKKKQGSPEDKETQKEVLLIDD
ncbi:MAG TPA: PD-(D/E)XK nuclease family protein [Candidatus Thermoplasmatota archaeon]|nr:PD-(D/E)XK nuclease family protein [Candidatus Thermoplasmatota archaeon]